MSNQDVVTSFRLAAEALEKLPQLEESHSRKEAALALATKANADLQYNIANLVQTINELQGKVRSLEVERDEAGFRELETKENLEAMLRTFHAVAGLANEAVAEHSPKPEPKAANATATAAPYDDGMRPIANFNPEVIEPQAAAQVDEPKVEPAVEPNKELMDKASEMLASPNTLAPDFSDGPVDEWAKPKEGAAPTATEFPFLGISPADKPHDVSWKDFVSGGGRRPFWVTDEMMSEAA